MGHIDELIDRPCDDLVHASASWGYTFGQAYLRNADPVVEALGVIAYGGAIAVAVLGLGVNLVMRGAVAR